MNLIILSGHLGADISIRTIGNGAIVGHFSLATNKAYTNRKKEKVKETSWHKVEVWGKVAETMNQFTKKGSKVTVTGQLVYETFQNKEDKLVTVAKVKAANVEFLDNLSKENKNIGTDQKKIKIEEAVIEESSNSIDDLPF